VFKLQYAENPDCLETCDIILSAPWDENVILHLNAVSAQSIGSLSTPFFFNSIS